MQALKALVVGMGILILLGVGIIAVTIYRRATSDAPPAPAAAAPATPSATTAAAAFGARDLALPPGSRVLGVTGAGHLVVVHARDADGRDRLLALDPATGRQLGEWRLAPPPAGAP